MNEIRKKVRILIVEDEMELASLLQVRLEKEGWSSSVCGKVSEALLKVNNEKFGAILLDLRLEQGSGERILGAIRQDPMGFNYATPVILMSGHLDPAILKKLREKIQAAFVKPFDTAQLVEKIRSFVGPKSS